MMLFIGVYDRQYIFQLHTKFIGMCALCYDYKCYLACLCNYVINYFHVSFSNCECDTIYFCYTLDVYMLYSMCLYVIYVGIMK